MTRKLFCGALIWLVMILSGLQAHAGSPYVLVIHGGAGNIPAENLTAERQAAYIEKLTQSLRAGEAILQNGGSSLDAVEAAVKILEDSPLFNAGKGAVFSIDGVNELDAAIMDGSSLNAGAVAGITNMKNPITVARKVMEHSPHVMLIGKGAEQFGFEQGLEVVNPSYFFDQQRWDQYREHLRRQQMRGSVDPEHKMGTVGAVALDMHGNLAAATSTGGMTGKRYGRVGDVPIIGAGTYANNKTCAVSATGHGEYFIRYVVAHEISAKMAYGNLTLDEAASSVIETLRDAGGNGGVIAVDKLGNISMPFNTTSMFRGYITADGEIYTAILSD